MQLGVIHNKRMWPLFTWSGMCDCHVACCPLVTQFESEQDEKGDRCMCVFLAKDIIHNNCLVSLDCFFFTWLLYCCEVVRLMFCIVAIDNWTKFVCVFGCVCAYYQRTESLKNNYMSPAEHSCWTNMSHVFGRRFSLYWFSPFHSSYRHWSQSQSPSYLLTV